MGQKEAVQMRGTVLRITAAVAAGAALFAGGHVCAHFVHPSGDPPALRVTLTLYDQDGRPLCQSERSVSSQPQKDSWQGVIALPDGRKGSYSVAVQPEK